jgi:hypothetical protein
MSSEDKSLIAEHDEKLIQMMAQAHASSLLQLEALKLRFAHYEKLAALCAVTLALSFTASTASHGPNFRALGALPHLLRSWQLLMLAIGLAVIANWLGVSGMANFANFAFMKQIDVRFSLLYIPLLKLDPEYAKKERLLWRQQMERAARGEKTSDVLIRLSSLFGFLAQVAAFGAFVALYFFAKAALAG